MASRHWLLATAYGLLLSGQRYIIDLICTTPVSTLAQASSQWWELVNWIDHAARRNQQRRTWLWGSITLGVLLIFQWQLVLAVGLGLGAMALIYRLQKWFRSGPEAQRQQVWNRLSRPLPITLGGGLLTMLTLYLTFSAWSEFRSPWLGLGLMLQGLMIAILLMLGLRQVGTPAPTPDADFDRILTDLTATAPLKRLIAVRQATRWITQARLDGWYTESSCSTARQHLRDCFRLMLSHETEPIVRHAVLEGLQVLRQERILLQESAAPSLPLPMQASNPVSTMRQQQRQRLER